MSDTQIFQIFSVLYLAVGVGMLINREFYKKLFEAFPEDITALYFGGIAALFVGYLIVAFHNTWTKDLSVIITIFGWIALIKGVWILVWPKSMIAMCKAMAKKEGVLKIYAIAVIIVGLGLSFLGFCPRSPI